MANKIITENQTELINKLCELIEKHSDEAIREKDKFYIGLSGGSLVNFLLTGLSKIKTDFSKWKIYFCDERIVSEDNEDSTYGVYSKNLKETIPVKDEQFVKIKQGLSAEDTAKDYASKLDGIPIENALPRFDMLLLGMGPDGHTCSLFPNHPLLTENKLWIASITDSPKPPPSRVTMTFPVVNNSKCCIFAMAGEGKSDMVKRILVDKEDLPAGKVQPTNGQLYWILDKSAAKYIH